jgi:hypothetical protein
MRSGAGEEQYFVLCCDISAFLDEALDHGHLVLVGCDVQRSELLRKKVNWRL